MRLAGESKLNFASEYVQTQRAELLKGSVEASYQSADKTWQK